MKLVISLLVGLVLAGGVSPAADVFVAANDSDTRSGKLAEPQGDDGPFATLERARNAVRGLKAQAPGEDIVVQIRGGQYGPSETVVFGFEDSGEGDATVTYEAFPGEKPVFNSDIEIGDWKKLEDEIPFLPEAALGKVWVTDVPNMNGAAWRFLTLYDAAGRLPRARSAGFIPVESSSRRPAARHHRPEASRIHPGGRSHRCRGADGCPGAQSDLPRTYFHPRRELSGGGRRQGSSARLGDARQGQCIGSSARS